MITPQALTDVTKLIDSKHDHQSVTAFLSQKEEGRSNNRGEINHCSEATRIIGACDDNGIRKEFVITPEPPFESLFLLRPYPSPPRQILTPSSFHPFPRTDPIHSKSVMRARPTFVGNGCLKQGNICMCVCVYMRARKMNPQVCVVYLISLWMGGLRGRFISGKKFKRKVLWTWRENLGEIGMYWDVETVYTDQSNIYISDCWKYFDW